MSLFGWAFFGVVWSIAMVIGGWAGGELCHFNRTDLDEDLPRAD